MKDGEKSTRVRVPFGKMLVVGILLLALIALPGTLLRVAAALNASPGDGPYVTTVNLVVLSPNPAYIEQPVTVTAEVNATDPLAGTPTGQVQIRSGEDIICLLVLNASGQVSCTVTYNVPRLVPLKAVYLGDLDYLPSASIDYTLVIQDKHRPTITITSHSPDPSIINRPVDVAVTVSSLGPTPTGVVTVYRSNATCTSPSAAAAVDSCSFTLAGGTGQCSLALTAPGEISLCASYPGDIPTYPGTGSVLHYVSISNTFTTITSVDPEPSVINQAAWVNFSVSSPDGTIPGTGTVVVSSGAATCSAQVQDGRCQIVFTQPHLVEVVAHFLGGMDGNVVLDPGYSRPYLHRVNAPPVDITLSSTRVDALEGKNAKVADIGALDPNTDESHIFSLVVGDGSQDNDTFAIQGTELRTARVIPLQKNRLYIRIRATDPAGLFYEKAFVIRVSQSSLLLPSTGFAPGRLTRVVLPPAEMELDTGINLLLEIPALQIRVPIVGVPVEDGKWQTDWLGNAAGWLWGSAFPTWQGNSVLAGHNYLSDGSAGPFVGLDALKYGDELWVHSYGNTYVYAVQTVNYTSPDSTSVLTHEEKAWLTLITCRSYDEKTDTYRWRVVVRAVLVEIR